MIVLTVSIWDRDMRRMPAARELDDNQASRLVHLTRAGNIPTRGGI